MVWQQTTSSVQVGWVVPPEPAIRGECCFHSVTADPHGPTRADPRTLYGELRARRALGLLADRARRNTRSDVTEELGTETVEVEPVHSAVIRVVASRLIEERLAHEEVLTEAVEVEARHLARTRGLADEVVGAERDRGQEHAIGANLDRGRARRALIA